MSFPYFERSLSLLNPWVIDLDPDANIGTDSLNENLLVGQVFYTELNMAAIAMHRRQFDLAEGPSFG
jgi:hypothetical protein